MCAGSWESQEYASSPTDAVGKALIYMEIISRQEAKSRGLTRYFTGKPCKHGHVVERLVGNSGCIECKRIKAGARNAAWISKNPEKRKAQKKRHYEKNKEKILAKQVEYKERTVEARKAYFKKYNENRREAKLRDAAEYRAKNAERINAHLRAYTKQNRDKYNAYSKLRATAKMHRTPTWLTGDDVWLMKEIYALATLRTKLTKIKWHVDHIIPLQGSIVSGLHVPTNLQVITQTENIRKFNSWDPDNG